MRKIERAEALEIVRRLRNSLETKGVHVRQAFLFGSIALDNAHDWSDIDVAIVHDPFLETAGKEKSLLFEHGKTVDPRMEVVAFRPSDFENKYSSLVSEVKAHGVPFG